MPNPLMLTKLALPILMAALKADAKQLHALRNEHTKSAASLDEALSTIENRRLFQLKWPQS